MNEWLKWDLAHFAGNKSIFFFKVYSSFPSLTSQKLAVKTLITLIPAIFNFEALFYPLLNSKPIELWKLLDGAGKQICEKIKWSHCWPEIQTFFPAISWFHSLFLSFKEGAGTTLVFPHWEREGAGSAAEGFLLKPSYSRKKPTKPPKIQHCSDPKGSPAL